MTNILIPLSEDTNWLTPAGKTKAMENGCKSTKTAGILVNTCVLKISGRSTEIQIAFSMVFNHI